MSNQQVTKKQHHFPQMMLKRFTNKDGQIFMYDSVSKKVSAPRSTETVGYQNHLYSVHYEGRKDDALEKKFAKIESDAEHVVNKILSKDIIDNAPSDIQSFLEFIAILISRTPKLVELAESKGSSERMQEILLEKGKEKGFQDSKIQSYLSKVQSNKGFSFANTFNTCFEDIFLKIVNNFNPLLQISTSDSKDFLVSDNYATFELIGNVAIDPSRTDWWKLNMHIHCPVSSSVCLTFIPKDDPAKVDTGDLVWSKKNIDNKIVSNINQLTSKQYERYLYCADENEIKRYT